MEMAGGLGLPSALPGVKLATDDRPSADYHRWPPLLPFFFFFPCFFFLLARHHLPLGGSTVGRTPSDAALAPLGTATCGPSPARWQAHCRARTDVGAKLAPTTEGGCSVALFLPSPITSSGRASTVGAIEVLNAVMGEATECYPSLSLSFFFPEWWHGRPNAA